ncbi:MAG: HAD family hydrolase [Candidatus Eremiobacterota bacterium]
MRFLALDFDGVLWDSVGECYVVAREAWRQLTGEEPPDCEAAFRSGRWLARVGGDFQVLLALAAQDPSRDLTGLGREEFERLKAGIPARFTELFYAERVRMRDTEPERWAALQGPYPAVLEELPALRRAFGGLAIATTKDAASVRALLASCGLDCPVLGREFGTHKPEQILHLCQEWGTTPQSVVFVDDLLDNLEPVRRTGAAVALAGWGYNTPAERRAAERAGIPVLQPGRVEEGLRAAHPV